MDEVSIHSLPRALVGFGVSRPTVSRLVVRALLAEPRLRARVLHGLSDAQSAASSFATAVPAVVAAVGGFEDCAWLFDSNVLNHSLARQTFAEAAYLYRFVRALEVPRVAEIGRYKGGTTFVLAAAGATVVSLDAREPTRDSDNEIRRALERFGLGDRVELIIAPSHSYRLDVGDRFDLVFFDVPGAYDYVRSELDRWWATLPEGGSLIVRDGVAYPPEDSRAAVTRGVVAAAREFQQRPDVRRLEDAPGTYLHLLKER
jgi:predicted O-methyltransferase YrrM